MHNSRVNDNQVGGTHYKTAIQHWDFVAQYGLGYFEGQVTKYVTRWRKKGGVQDLRKAKHFLDKLNELAAHAGYVAQTSAQVRQPPEFTVAEYCLANQLGPTESKVVELMAEWARTSDTSALLGASLLLLSLLDEVEAAEPSAAYVNQDR
jgi:hypothetical protein